MLDEIEVGPTVLSPCDVAFRNLGTVLNVYNKEGKYNDTFVGKDSTAGTSAADGKTVYFSYTGMIQLSDAQGNPSFAGEYLKATAVKAEPIKGSFNENGDSGIMEGMDVTYTHYFTRRRSFGVVVGFNTNGFSFKRSADWDVNLVTRSDLYKAEGLEGMSSYTGSYVRPRIFDPTYKEAYLYYENPIHLGEKALSGKQSATGEWDLAVAYANFRLGGAYNLTLTRHFTVRASGGLVLVDATSRFTWDESYTAPLDTGDTKITSSGTAYKHKFLVGGWADLAARYRVNRVMSVFGSLQCQASDSLNYTTSGGQTVNLDSSSLYTLKTGFCWAF
jgi:hypothetical protein